MSYLLDTCTFLWLAIDDPQLSKRVRKIVANPENNIYFSAASAFEIGIKYRLGKLPLPISPSEYIPSRRERMRIQALPFAEADALQIYTLPDFHRDPFDRMLVAQAMVHRLAVLTPDRAIARYPVQVIWD